ncbi:MAG: hypothetical protein OXN89_26170 [Bryobacterales bacterium]|nr:hypothetical protein [Bryobacterales bacterium]
MFELLFKFPLAAYRKGEVVFATGWPGWLLAGAAVAAAAALLWHARRSPSRLSPATQWAVWGLQSLTAALVLALLWQPALAVQSLKSRQNAVAVLVDTSRSMALVENGQTRLAAAAEALREHVLPGLGNRFRIRLYGFSTRPERLPSLEPAAFPEPGASSAIGESVVSVLRESTAVPLGALLVVSDGSDNSGRFTRQLATEIRQHNVPVHTVGVGRVRIDGDIELSDISVPSRSLPRSRVSAQMTVRHSLQDETSTRITVRDGSGVVAVQPVTLNPGEPVTRVWLDFGAGEPGVRDLTFAVEPAVGEEIEGNNRRRHVLDVPRRRRRILYAEGEPRWQYKFMRRAVAKDASVQLVTLLRTSTNKFYRQGVDTPEELEDGFPSGEEDLFAYDALIIGSFEAAFFTPKQQVAIREFVSRRGGTLMMLAGRRGLGAGGWQNSEIVDALPARLEAGEASFLREKVRVEIAPQGRDSLISRLSTDPQENQELWEGLPELADFQRIGPLKPAATTLLSVRYGTDSLPLLLRHNYGRGRSIIFATGGTWRWRMGLPSDDERHDTFWRQLLRALVVDSAGPVRLTSDRSTYADESRVILRAEVRDRSYRHANNARVSATVHPEEGPPRTVPLGPSASEPGVYEAEVDAPQTGVYQVEAVAHLGDERLGADTLHVRREGGVAEDFRPERNATLLERLAEQTGGAYWELDELDALPAEIGFSEAGITTREVLDLWDMPAVFLLLLALRASEWLLRKRGGIV